MLGTVLWYDKRDKKGIIQDENYNEYYVDESVLTNCAYLDPKDKVEFEINTAITDCLCAHQVKLTEEQLPEECSHNEHDHFICLDCGEELDPGVFIDRAMDYYDFD